MSLSSPKPVVPRHAAQRLQRRLCRHIGTLSPGKPDVSVHLTDNCSTMLSVRREPGRYRLRLHHMFVSASAQVVAALGRYDFPGNVREPENILERALALCSDNVIRLEDLQAGRAASRRLRPAQASVTWTTCTS